MCSNGPQLKLEGGADSPYRFTVASVPSITTSSPIPPGVAGQPYSVSLQFSLSSSPWGETIEADPLTWSVASGTLPNGLSLNPSTGVISGTPTTATTSTFTVQVQDAVGQTGSKVLTLYVFSPLTITTTSLPEAVNGSAYSPTIQVTSGTAPFTWSITSGALPADLLLDPTSGTISGIPTTNGTSNFVIKVVDTNGASATQSLSITVVAKALAITTATTLPGGKVAVAYSKTLAGTGGLTPYGWSLVAAHFLMDCP